MTFPSQDNRDFSSHQQSRGPSGADEVLRGMLSSLVQEAIEREFERHMGAGPWERAGGDIVEQLARLTAAGIDVHTQIVLVSGVE